MSTSQALWSPEAPERKQEPGQRPTRPAWTRVELEQEILDVLVSVPAPDDTIELAFQRKGAALVSLFDRLSVTDAFELRRRLTLCRPDDPIAVRFARLVIARRQRLLTFLEGARRREALRSGRR